MGPLHETLDAISRRGEAMFAMDASNRIIHWNKASEALFGQPARAVMGKRCYEVLDGRDANGNHYCQLSCPVAGQARTGRDHHVCPFELEVKTGDGSRKTIATSLFAIESYHPALATLVHICREPEIRRSASETKGRSMDMDSLEPARTPDGGTITLTCRETEVLQGLGRGLRSAEIGEALSIAEVTVRNHVSKILIKLQVHSKLAAVVFAYQHNLIGRPAPV